MTCEERNLVVINFSMATCLLHSSPSTDLTKVAETVAVLIWETNSWISMNFVDTHGPQQMNQNVSDELPKLY